ncbi:MAG: alpha/beta hydrolase [Anaerolineaceae bacterium]|nr:alpha/beta hydrolase [Anaerolineaceae bacterium]
MLRSLKLLRLKKEYTKIWKQPLPELTVGMRDPHYELVEKIMSHYQRHSDDTPLMEKTPQRLRSDARMEALIHHQFSVHLPPVSDIWNEMVPSNAGEIPVRVYLPAGRGPYPILIYIHGGKWTYGDLDTTFTTAVNILHKTGWVVITMDYRLAPEHPFPAALHDCYAILQWASKQENALPMRGDASQIIVAGQGTGGNLAASLCLYTREHKGPVIVSQILINPILDLLNLDAISSNANIEEVKFFVQQHIKNSLLLSNPLVSPLLASDLAGLPPAVIAAAEFAPLRSQSKKYVEKLSEANIPADFTLAEGMENGFFTMQHLLPRADFYAQQILETAITQVKRHAA